MLTEGLGLADARVISLCGGGGKSSLMFALAREWAAAGERVLVTTTTRIARSEAADYTTVFAADAAAVLARMASITDRLVVAMAANDADPVKLRGFPPEEIDRLAASGRFTRVLVEADGSRRKPLKAPAAHEPVFPASTDVVIMVAGLSGLGHPLSEDVVMRPEIWSTLTGGLAGAPIAPLHLARVATHPDGLAKGAPGRARRILFLNQADDAARIDAARAVHAALAACEGRRPDRTAIARLSPEPRIHECLE